MKRILSPTAQHRFSTKYKPAANGCWIWTAAKTPLGYGMFMLHVKAEGRALVGLAHRASWVLHEGEIPEGMLVCHRCDNPSCVNPEHLFIGSSADNLYDMIAKGRGRMMGGRKKQTHCKRGHELNDESVIFNTSTQKRYCKICDSSRRKLKRESAHTGDSLGI